MESITAKLTVIEPDSEAIVLLHGLARTSCSMAKAEGLMARYGYKIVNAGYPSRKYTVQELALNCIRQAVKECESPRIGKIHFLTHSLGGILIRYYLSVESIDKLGRVVMLAPPNQGSEVVDQLGGWKLFYWLNGPAAMRFLGSSTALISVDFTVHHSDFYYCVAYNGASRRQENTPGRRKAAGRHTAVVWIQEHNWQIRC